MTILVSVLATINAFLQLCNDLLSSDSISAVANMSIWAWVSLCIVLSTWWSYKLWTQKDWSVADYTSLLYLILFVIVELVVVPVTLACEAILCQMKPNCIGNELITILVPIYMYVIAMGIMTVIPGRIARYEAIISKDHIISTKQAYVRYISHELRYDKCDLLPYIHFIYLFLLTIIYLFFFSFFS
jgi:hypothetical protein